MPKAAAATDRSLQHDRDLACKLACTYIRDLPDADVPTALALFKALTKGLRTRFHRLRAVRTRAIKFVRCLKLVVPM
jgi:hypothetical protein